MTSASVTLRAGEVSFWPLTLTRPAAIQASASRREQRPARAIALAMRSPAASLICARSFRVGRRDQSLEQLAVALADAELGMPLHADAEGQARIFDPLDDAVGGDGVDDDAGTDRFHRLMMRA